MRKLSRALNYVNEASWLDKASNFLDKYDPDRSKLRGLAKTALALIGGGEMDDQFELIKKSRSEVDPAIKDEIALEASRALGRTKAEINQFTRLPEKERTERVKAALENSIFKKRKISYSVGKRLYRELFKEFKDSLWNNYKVTLKEGLPPVVNFEGDLVELTTTESNDIDNIVQHVQAIIEKDLNEQDFDNPEFKKKIMALCLKYAKADKRLAKKAFQKILSEIAK